MAVTGYAGIDVRQSGDRLIFDAFLQDNSGALVSTGTTVIRIFQVENDGTFKSYDFNDNTFKTTALTTATQALTHRTGNNGTYNTGLWSYALTTLSGFTVGANYRLNVNSTVAFPADQMRAFVFGGQEGDAPAAAPTAAVVADAVWDEARSGHVAAGSFGEGVASVQGNVTGSVGSVTGAVGSVTGAVGSVTGAVGSVTGAVGSVTGNVGGNVVGSVASVVGAVGSVTGLTASNLDAAVSTRLATAGYTTPPTTAAIELAVWDKPDGLETGKTMRQGAKASASVAAGVSSGMTTTGGTAVFDALGNPGTARVEAPLDAAGNRTSVTLTL